LKKDNPNVSFPTPLTDSFLEQYGIFPVHQTSKPDRNWDEDIEEINPTFDGEKWVQSWQKIKVDTEERKNRISDMLANVRSERNRLLSECDWTQLSDCSLSKAQKKEWAVYRQNLRDLITESVEKNPFKVQWPVKPT
jgi:hypothetical protein